jgi:type II secretory pathway pseudopilin PulG
MKIRLRKPGQQATTLVDVIMAVAIIAIMCAGLVGSLTYGFYTMGIARENQRGTQLLLETLETIRLYNWDQVNSNGFIPDTFTGVYDPQAAPGQQGITYYGTITKGPANIAGAPAVNTNLMLMTVTLSWTNRGISHARTNCTLIARDGIQNYVN